MTPEIAILLVSVWWLLFGFTVGWLCAKDRTLRLAAKRERRLTDEVLTLRQRLYIAEKDQC
jgi:hypothetical protein